MENEKKPSRFGVRLSSIIAAVLLVVCMAVPAFAVDAGYEGVYPSGLPSVPEVNPALCLVQASNEYRLYWVFEGDTLVNMNGYWKWNTSRRFYTVVDGVWTDRGNTDEVYSQSLDGIVIWSQREFVFTDSNGYVFGELIPPPDFKHNVSSGLTVVLDWVGSVVSAVVSGPMSGLLILLAVPVAISMLLVAFIVIRRIIWGA